MGNAQWHATPWYVKSHHVKQCGDVLYRSTRCSVPCAEACLLTPKPNSTPCGARRWTGSNCRGGSEVRIRSAIGAKGNEPLWSLAVLWSVMKPSRFGGASTNCRALTPTLAVVNSVYPLRCTMVGAGFSTLTLGGRVAPLASSGSRRAPPALLWMRPRG